ncbi:uncharacterized protein LOC131635557 [Vicia villosa]|uniref:uncharacterized protein LOC131635557 n=1 Tax=Vicia villosa TaxID=3911 RepID=UPI00273BE7FB|nr:uncharacterized protein LOC131635557 [Vicia villosa]
MNLVTLNVRGCGNSVKRSRIRQVLLRGKTEMCFIQETKLENMKEELVRSMWGHSEFEWSAKGSEGRSSGILTIWKKDSIIPVFSFRGEWIVGGDFNAVKIEEERRGRTTGGRMDEMVEFGDFIELMNLVDVPEVGSIHTWINPGGTASSRLDRFLISDGIIQDWNIVAQVTGDRDISDHMPVWIKASNLDWGPKPFKVFNSWFQHKDFLKFVKEAWDSFQVRGKKYFVVMEKFRLLKAKLRWWNVNVFGWVDLKIDKGVDTLNELETELIRSGGLLSEEEAEKRRDSVETIWNNLHLKESMIKQKARQNWIQEGDLNTKFFHVSLKARNRRNAITSIHTGHGTLEDVGEVKEDIKIRFSNRFRAEEVLRPSLNNLEFRRLSDVDSVDLEEMFSREEIKEAIFESEGDKSPGPDGFNLEFIKKCWSIVGEDSYRNFTN